MFHLSDHKKVVIFCCGSGAEKVTKVLGANVSYYVDNNKEKWGTPFFLGNDI